MGTRSVHTASQDTMDQRCQYQCLAAQRSWLEIVQFVLEGAAIRPASSLSVPDSIALEACLSSDNLNVCLSVCRYIPRRTEHCTDFTEAFAAFQTLYCTVSRYTCSAFLATNFLKLSTQQQRPDTEFYTICKINVFRAVRTKCVQDSTHKMCSGQYAQNVFRAVRTKCVQGSTHKMWAGQYAQNAFRTVHTKCE